MILKSYIYTTLFYIIDINLIYNSLQYQNHLGLINKNYTLAKYCRTYNARLDKNIKFCNRPNPQQTTKTEYEDLAGMFILMVN